MKPSVPMAKLPSANQRRAGVDWLVVRSLESLAEVGMARLVMVVEYVRT